MAVLRASLLLLLVGAACASELVWPERVLMRRRSGFEPDPYIVDGDVIDIKDAPHQLSLQRYNSHICGASIISKSFALTAGHCAAVISAKSASFRAGSSRHHEGGVLYQAQSVTSHPHYDGSTVDYDVAVVQIVGEFQLGEAMRIVALPAAGEDGLAGNFLTVTGWGDTHEGGHSGSLQLRGVQVVALSQRTCALAYGKAITERMLCAGRAGADSCQGDSGGPLVRKAGKAGANTKLVGVVSWGYGCARRGIPGVYARVANPQLREFIKKVSGV